MTPLTDLGLTQYLGYAGGLYPDGQNSRPSVHERVGVALGATVQALDKAGVPSPPGTIVMLSIGMSNTSREFSEFIELVETDSRKNPSLSLIDAAREGGAATQIADPSSDYWAAVDERIRRASMSPAQVQVAWLKTALAHDSRKFPDNARLLQRSLRAVLGILGTKFPQLKLVYVSSRTYGGYSRSNLSPEPIAYESAFAVKWLIEERINHADSDKSIPWVSWGPYLWADGMRPRRDGLTWERADFEPDGVHTSDRGAAKVAATLLEFFATDPTAQPWFSSQRPL